MSLFIKIRSAIPPLSKPSRGMYTLSELAFVVPTASWRLVFFDRLPKLHRRQVFQRAVRSHRIEVNAEGFAEHLGFGDRREPMFVEESIPHFPVEAFDVPVLRRLAWIDEDELDAMRIGPAIERLTDELRAVVPSRNEAKASQVLL